MTPAEIANTMAKIADLRARHEQLDKMRQDAEFAGHRPIAEACQVEATAAVMEVEERIKAAFGATALERHRYLVPGTAS